MGTEYIEKIDIRMDIVKKAMEIQDRSNVFVYMILLCNEMIGLLLVLMQDVEFVISVITCIVFVPIVTLQLAAGLYWIYFFVGPRRLGFASLLS